MARKLLVLSPAIAPSLSILPSALRSGQVGIPHFDLPFRFNAGKAAVVEQDSLDDVVNCVEAAVRTENGSRKELPTFGVREMTFEPQPVDTAGMMAHIMEHEPRAELFTEQHPSVFDQFVAEVRLEISSGIETPEEEAELEAVRDF
jgi:phage baseplate assembly protein W